MVALNCQASRCRPVRIFNGVVAIESVGLMDAA
jgi:hypothetical protein